MFFFHFMFGKVPCDPSPAHRIDIGIPNNRIKIIEKTFGRIKANGFTDIERAGANLTNGRREFFRKRKGLKLAYLALGYRVPGSDHPDFLKLTSVIDVDKLDFEKLGKAARALANAEGLEAHARAIEKRLEAKG
jgi:hypothetical protein